MGLKGGALLGFYAKQFRTVEMNNTFYIFPTKERVLNWLNETPQDFLFAVKVHRLFTHYLHLRVSSDSIMRFISVIENFGDKLGPLLFQCHRDLKCNLADLEYLCSNLPPKLLYAFEFRHPSWFTKDTYEILSKLQATICITNQQENELLSSTHFPFAYIRLHGPQEVEKYNGCYPDRELQYWADSIKTLHRPPKPLFCYFNNDVHGHAIKNAVEIIALLG